MIVEIYYLVQLTNKTRFKMKHVFLTGILILLTTAGIFAQYPTKITVAQDGSGDYTTIQAGIDACKAYPDQRVTVYIKNGIYHEKVLVPACSSNLSIIGESAEKTILTFDDYFSKINRGRNSTFYTYTLKVEADDFYAENLTIENSSGPVGQGVALHVQGDRCVFKNCRILGHQDTLYTEGETSRLYFSNCFIEGTTDFIFGAATALFENCVINSKVNSFITAASTPKDNPFGYVFKNCKLTADVGVDQVYLGRPWREYAKTVFLHCEMGAHILPEGWGVWSNSSNLQTTYYAEYGNTGPGADVSKRVGWSHQLSEDEALNYTDENILAPVLAVEFYREK